MRHTWVLLIGFLIARADPATPQDFETAVRSTGEEYRKARDRLLGPGVDVHFLEGKLRSDSPKERLTAAAVLGWRDHGDEYSKLLEDVRTDARGAKHYRWAFDPASVQPEYLPLFYEFLLTGDAPTRTETARAIAYLARRGTDVDVGALTALLSAGNVPDSAQHAIATTLAFLPATAVKARDLLPLLEQQAKKRPGNPGVALELINGMITRGSGLSTQEREDVVGRLLGLDGLQTLIGETPVVIAANGIGGRTAAERVARLLDRDDPAQRREAISALASNDDPAASRALARFVQKGDLKEPERVYVIQRLAGARYDPGVGTALAALFASDERTDRERLLALTTLDQLHLAHLSEPDAERDLRARLEGLKVPARHSQALKDALDRVQSDIARSPRVR